MNWDEISGNWKTLTGRVRTQWGKLTDDDLHQIAGRRDELIGRLQARYGHAREKLETEIDDFIRSL